MIGLLEAIAELSVLAFVVGSMLAAEMSHSPADVIAPLKRALPVTLGLLVNFAFAPLLALGMTLLVIVARLARRATSVPAAPEEIR